MSGRSKMVTEVTDFLRKNPDGTTNEQLKAHFGAQYEGLASILNNLLEARRIVMYTNTVTKALTYRLVSEETTAGLEGLGPEQMLVYHICEKAGNKGIWTRDIKTQTNIAQPTLTKTLKILEQRNLIKNVRSVVSRSKRYYMLFSATPSKEITGGPWYTDQEFDHAFVEDLCKMILGIVRQQTVSDSRTILARLISTKIIDPGVIAPEDLETVMQMLVHDGRLEEVRVRDGEDAGGILAQVAPLHTTGDFSQHTSLLSNSSSSSSSGSGSGSGSSGSAPPPRYKVAKDFSSYNHLTETPCGVCPVITQCTEGGLISPTTCPYISDWMAADW